MQLDTPIRAGANAPLEYAAPALNRKSRLDPFALATHLVGWLVVLLLLEMTVVFFVPRFEQVFRDFAVSLPDITRQFLGIAREARDWLFWAVMVTVALAHSFAAAWWYRRASEPKKLAYRLVMMLVLAAALLFVVAALYVPLFRIMSALSTSAPAGPRPAPAGPASTTSI